MIKAGCGEWVAPAEIEDALLGHPAVVDAAVVGRSDHEGVIYAKAYVVLSEQIRPSEELEEALKGITRERWPGLPHKHLHSVEFASSLPRTTTGKLQRFKLQPESLTEFSYKC